MDKDVETDIIPYDQYGNTELIRQYHNNSYYLNFLPYTPEVLLIKTFYYHKDELIGYLRQLYFNQQLNYATPEQFDFPFYEQPFPNCNTQNEYKSHMDNRGAFRKRCKAESERIALQLRDQINQSIEEIYRVVFKFSIDCFVSEEINIQQMLASTMKRISR